MDVRSSTSFITIVGIALIALAASLQTPIEATVCDLVRRPLDFANKQVRIQGRARFIFELRALVDDNCPSDGFTIGLIWLDFGDPEKILKYFGGWNIVDYAKAWKAGQLNGENTPVAWQSASEVSPPEPGKISEFYQALKKKRGGKADKDVFVTIIGRFDFAEHGLLIYTQDRKLTFKPGFGHMGYYSRRIAIESIEFAKEKK
jgi:hypothetical protein